jgi:hypothetical protein
MLSADVAKIQAVSVKQPPVAQLPRSTFDKNQAHRYVKKVH